MCDKPLNFTGDTSLTQKKTMKQKIKEVSCPVNML
jgi:hypothetical protein